MSDAGGKGDTRPRKERRRETGEDFTPIPLVNEILDRLPADSWENPDMLFLDPSCGNGNFLVEIKKRLLAAGHSEENALSRILGIDIMHDNVVAACKRLGVDHDPEASFAVSRTIICANTLEHKGKLRELFEMAEKEFKEQDIENFCKGLKCSLMSIKPLIKGSPPGPLRDEAVKAFKISLGIIKNLRTISTRGGESLD